MDTRNFYTKLPEHINRQIEQKTQVNDVNTQSVATTMQDGIEPLYLSQLNNSFDSNIPPAMPQIQWVTYFEDGKPVVEMTIIFSGKDKLGHDVKGQVIADIYRDKDNSGTFEDDEHIDSIDLQQTNKFVDRGAPVDETVRYKILLKNMGNRQQTWSDPIIVSTSDNVTPYTPPVGVDPDTLLDEIVVLTDNLNSVTNGDNCNAVLKIKEHDDEEFRLFEINIRVVGATNWEKQSDVLSDTALVSGYYYIGLKNLIRGKFYEVRVRAQRKSGNASAWSDSIQFMAGDFIGPQKPENVFAVNVSTDVALGMQINWSAPLATGNKGIQFYRIYRWEYNNAAGQFVDASKTLIGDFQTSLFPSMVTWAYIDETVVDGTYYAYEVSAYDNSATSLPSSSVWTYPDLATYISDSSLITLDYINDDNTFPITVDWTPYAGGYHGTYIVFRENDEQKRVLFQKDFPNTTKSYTITLQDFKEEDAKDFLEIEAWQTTHNYTIEVGAVYNATYAGTRRTRAGKETLLINPKPEDVLNFVATYDAIRHQMDFKWTKNTDAILTGYEIRSITEADWNALQAITGTTPSDVAARKLIWDSQTAVTLATAKVLNKDASDWTWQMPTSVTPSPTDPIAYYFLIRAVGDFFVDYQYRSADFSKIIYSQESGESTTSVLQKLPAPVVDTVAYTSAQLDGKVMRVNWTIALTADQKRQFKEFWLYMSTTATNVDSLNPTYRIWRGADLTTTFEKDHLGNALNYATTYYFRVVAVDHYDYPGNLSERFSNYPAGTLSVLPKSKITGTDFVRTIPIELNSRSETPLSSDDTVSVYKSRSMQFEITAAFTKNRYVDRIKWYISNNDGPYTYVTETFFDKEKVNAEVLIPAGFKQSYSFSTDQVLFRIKAVQYRPDGVEGSLPSTPASNYAKIDTMVPNLDIQKIWYKSDNSIAINKNGYINKKILANGIDIYYRAYEKDSNSGINRVEYNYSGSTWVAATGSPINITNAMLGADTVGGIYKEFEIKLRAFDNAENSVEQVVRFKKDTVGPATTDLPTSLTWAFGRNITLSWVNPTKTNRNLYDGLKLYVGATLTTAKEYSLDSNPFSWKPASSPVQLFLAATDIADNLTYLDEDGVIQVDQDNPTVITITNAKPAPPSNLKLNSLVGGCEAFWDAVTLDIDGNTEEVEKYWIQYAIAETEPAVGSGDWTFPTNYETFSPKINISLSASQMDAFAANSGLKLWVRVDASDYWGLRSDPSTAAFVVPKNITAVDMGGNIFKMKLSSNMTLTGTQDYILDANYLDGEYISFTNATVDDYIKLDLVKAEWISDIKLKFKHSTSVRFVIKLEEVSGATTTDIWLQSSSSSDHTFNNVNDINVQTTTKPAADRYFEFATTDTSVGDIALLHYENFTTGRAIFAKSVSIYFYNADSVARNIVEFQPVVMSIANIFYGSEVNLDYLVSIRSKADTANYSVLTKENLTFYTTSDVVTSKLGKLDTGVYGAWLPKCYVGGSAYNNSPLSIDSNGRLIINSTAYSTSGTISVTQMDAGAGGGTWALCYAATAYGDWNFGYRATMMGSDNDTQVGYYTSSHGDRGTGTFTALGAGIADAATVNTKNYFIWLSSTRVDGHSNENERIIDYSLYTNGIGYCYYQIKAWHDGIDIYTNQYMKQTATLFKWECTSGSAWLNTSGNLTIGSLSDYASTSWKLYALGAIKHTSLIEQEQATPQVVLKNTSAYNIQTSTDNCTSIDFHNKYTSGGTSALQAQLVAWRYNYTSPPYDQSAWTRLTFRVLRYDGVWQEPVTIDYSGISTPYISASTVSGTSIYGTYITAYSQIVCYGNATTDILSFNNGGYASNGYGRLRFNGYVDSSYTAVAFASIHGGKTNTTNADYKGYLKLNTTYSSSYVEMCRILINAAGGVSIGQNAGVITQNHTGDLSAGESALFATACNADSSYSYAIHAKAYADKIAIYGYVSGTGYGVSGYSETGRGVFGSANSGIGVYGTSVSFYGVVADSGGTYSFYSYKGAVFATDLWAASMTSSSSGGTSYPIYIDGNGKFWKNTSSIKYKDNVWNMSANFNNVLYLRPVTFNWKSSGTPDYGYIAEEVAQVAPELVLWEGNDPNGVRYDRVALMLVEVVKGHRDEISTLKQMINEIKNKVDTLTKTE